MPSTPTLLKSAAATVAAVLLGLFGAAAPAHAAALEGWVSARQIGSTTQSEHLFSGSPIDIQRSVGSEPWTTHARARADYGTIKLDGQATLSGSAFAIGGFDDMVTISAPGVASGTLGTLTYSVVVEATLAISNTHSAADWMLRATFDSDPAWDIDEVAALCGGNISCSPGPAQPGTFTATTTFVYGVPTLLHVWLRGDAVVTANFANEPPSVASFDLANSAYWGGVSAVTVNGMTLDDYTLASESGTDWGRSFVPGVVPEPATWVLSLAGLAALGGLRGLARRRDQALR